MSLQSQQHLPSTGVLPMCTLVLWSVCLFVGIVGSTCVPRPNPAPKTKPIELVAEILRIESTPTHAPLHTSLPENAPTSNTPIQSQSSLSPPSAPKATVISAAPQWIAVQDVSPIQVPSQLSIPVQTAPQVAADNLLTKNSNSSNSTSQGSPSAGIIGTNTSSSHSPQSLIFGEGEGNQPAPRYPARAKVAGQQGTVVVQFSVGENGRVLAAEIVRPSPWPLLNEEALRTVRDRYRFRPGRFRVYEIGIRFELNR